MKPSGSFGRIVLASITLTAILTGLAYAQVAGNRPAEKSSPAHVVQEFTHIEVQAATVVATLNDLSKQGWDVFQVIPGWTIKNEDGTTDLVPKTYQVFARRPLPAK